MMFVRKLFNNPIESIAGAAVILGTTSLASKILGVIRNRILAGTFGAGDILDSYYAAFRFPDMVFNLVVLGALSAGFIPLFIKLLHQKKQAAIDNGAAPDTAPDTLDHWEFAGALLNITLLILGAFSLFLIIFADYFVPLITPGFSADKMAMTVQLSRIMAIGPIFLGISAIFSGVLQSFKKFFIYSLAPIFYNLGIIIGVILFVPWLGPVGLAWGVVLGTFLHALIQLGPCLNLGFKFTTSLRLRETAVRKIGKLMIPRTLGLAVSQFNFLAMTAIASTLSVGSVAVFNFANDIQSFPLGLFSISLATAAFPAFSSYAASSDKEGLRRSFATTASLILFLLIPSAVLLLLLRAQIVRVLLGWGEFDWGDTIATADTVAFLGLSLFAQGLLPLLTRLFYSLQDTLRPFLAGLFSVVFNLWLAWQFKNSFGIAGLALAFSLSTALNVILLWFILRIRFGSLGEKGIVVSLFKLSLAVLVMAAVVQGAKYLIAPLVNMRTFWGIFTQGFLSASLGIGIFILISLLLKNREMLLIKEAFRRRLYKTKEAKGMGGEGGVGAA